MLTFFELNITTTLSWFASFAMLALSMVVFLGSKEYHSRIFSFAALLTSVWAFLMGMHVGMVQELSVLGMQVLDFLPRSMHFLGGIIAALFFVFCALYSKSHLSKVFLWSVVLLSVLVWPIYFFTNLIVGGPTQWFSKIPLVGGNIWGWHLGEFILVYDVFFIIAFTLGVLLLYMGALRENNPPESKRLKSMAVIIAVGGIPPAVVNIILPYLGIFSFNGFSGVTNIFWVGVIAYSILKHHQLNLKIVAAEVMILGLMALLFISIFI